MASRLSSPVEPQSVTPLQGARPGMPLYVWCAGIMLLALSLFGGHGKPSGASDFSAKPHAEAGLSPSSSAGSRRTRNSTVLTSPSAASASAVR